MAHKETMIEVLNKVEAICKCGASSIKDLAKELHRPQSSVYDWVTQRKHLPPGDVALEMRFWAARKTLAIAMSTPQVRRAYRDAHAAIQEGHGK